METLTIRPDTRLIFAQALENVMESKSFQKITVNDITDACGAHRSTFYRHFADKMELAEWYFRYLADREAELIHKNGSNISDPHFAERVFLAILRMMQTKKSFFQKLAQYDGQNAFDKIFFRWNMDRMLESIHNTYNIDTLPPKIKYALDFYYYGETKLIMEWAINGMRETPETLLSVAVENVPQLLRPYVNLSSGPQHSEAVKIMNKKEK